MIEHKCHYPFDAPWTCDSGAQYEGRLHFECQAPGRRYALSLRGNPAAIECCAGHREACKKFLLSDANRETLTTQLRDLYNYPEPNWLTARVEFKSIGAPVEIVKTLQQCCRGKCFLAAQYRVMIAVPTLGNVRRVMESPTNLFVCEQHRATTKAKHVTDDEPMRKALYEALQKSGMVLPDLDKARVRFQPIELAAPVEGE